MEGRVRRYLCLVFCVVILYHDVCTLDISLEEQVMERDEKVSNNAYLEDLIKEGFNVTNVNDICADWQEFDGAKCVCSDHCSTHSEINMGMVCDSDGQRFPNLCEFTFKMCSEQILPSTMLTTCGLCNTLKLTGSQIYPEDKTQGLGFFKRDETGNTWTAVDDQGKTMKLFYSSKPKSWVIGSADQTQVGIVFKTYTPNPQDSDEGAVIVVNETYGTLDPFLHLECLPDTAEVVKRETNPLTREKRIFSFIILFTTATAATELAKASKALLQLTKGCTYYPDVCDMKKEIENTLKPEVQTLSRTFRSIVGEPHGFKNMVYQVYQRLLEVKKHMVDLGKLESEFRDLELISNGTSNDFVTSFNDQWLKELGKTTTGVIIGTNYFQMSSGMDTILNNTTSKASMAFATSGASLAIIPGVIGIVVGKRNEEVQREQLRNVKRNLIFSKEELSTALRDFKTFQINFYENAIYPLKKIAHHMRSYDIDFKFVYDKLVSMFGFSLSPNVGENVYGNITSNSVNRLKNQLLTPLARNLSIKHNKLKEKYNKTENLTMLIRNNINEQISPKEILSLIKKTYGKTAENIVPNEFLLLKFTAERVLKNESCYWGYDLELIRSDKIPESEIIKAKPSKSAFSSIKLLPENLQANALCSDIDICNHNWQTYVKCLLKTFDGGNMCKGEENC